ncbi:MAG: hypothetical protein ACOY0T_15175 [Myxococcota bacterium]
MKMKRIARATRTSSRAVLLLLATVATACGTSTAPESIASRGDAWGGYSCDKPGGPGGLVLTVSVPLGGFPVAPPVGPVNPLHAKASFDLGISFAEFDVLSVTQISKDDAKASPAQALQLENGNWGLTSSDGVPFPDGTSFNIMFDQAHLQIDGKTEPEPCPPEGSTEATPGAKLELLGTFKHTATEANTKDLETCLDLSQQALAMSPAKTFVVATQLAAAAGTVSARYSEGSASLCLVSESGQPLLSGSEFDVQVWAAE